MNRESERKRLVELLKHECDVDGRYDGEGNCPGCKYNGMEDCSLQELDDHLLNNGIVVPPFPVGERVFVVITYMPFVPDDVYECKIKAWMKYADKLSTLVEIVEEGIFKGLAVHVDDTDLFTSMAAAQTILEVKKKKSEKMLKGEGE